MPLPISIIVESLLLWIPFLVLLPFTLVIIVSLSIYKVSVLILRKLFKRHDLIRPISGLDVSFSTDNFYGRPLGSLAFIWNVDGNISPELIIHRLENVLKCRQTSELSTTTTREDEAPSSTNGFERLTSVYPVFWLGYPFWKKVDTVFDVRNHVRVTELGEKFTDPDGINKLICEWMQEPFTQGLPLWEIRIVTHTQFQHVFSPINPSIPLSASGENWHGHDDAGKCREDGSPKNFKVTSILILKTHHIIGDGKSMLHLLNKIVDSPETISHKMDNKMETTTSSTESNDEAKIKDKVPPNPLDTIKEVGSDTVLLKYDNSIGLIKIWKKVTTTTLMMVLVATGRRSNTTFGFLAEVNQKFLLICRQLSNIILLTFLTPPALFSLVYDFAIHRDAWFTNKKVSFQVNLATVGISLSTLSKIRKDLSHKPRSHLSGNGKSGSCNSINSKEVHHSRLVPMIVIAVSVLAGALRKFFSEKQRNKFPYRDKVETLPHWDENDVVHINQTTLTYPKRRIISTTNLPNFVNFVASLPLQEQHPGSTSFGNFWTHGILKVRMDENSPRRLYELSGYFWKMRAKRLPEINHALARFLSLLPENILRRITGSIIGSPIGVTNLCGPASSVCIGGQKVIRKYAYFGLQWRHACLTLALFSYNGELSISILANEDIIPNEKDLKRLLHGYLIGELGELRKSTEKNPRISSKGSHLEADS